MNAPAPKPVPTGGATKAAASAAPDRKVRCTTDRRPWVEGRPLELGEEADVPPELADHLVRHGLCVPA